MEAYKQEFIEFLAVPFYDSPNLQKTPYLRHLQHFSITCKSIVTYRKSV